MRSALSGWVRRAVALVAVAGGTVALVEAAGLQVDRVALALLVALGVGVLLLLLDVVPHEDLTWLDAVRVPAPALGRDRRLVGHLRALQDHLGTRAPDDALQHRLVRLAERRLLERHGLVLADPGHREVAAARELLGARVHTLLRGPAVRMSRAEVDRVVSALEGL